MNCDNNNNNSNNNMGCEDIPWGFQDLHPEAFIVIAEILGDVMAGNMPFNVQNAIGNWLTLVGQTILTYNAQQQYFQNGPGRYYDIKNKNVGNPFCQQTAQQPISNNKELENKIEDLRAEIEKLKREIRNFK